MNPKEIGRKAGKIFEYKIPENWIFRSQEDQEDYGIDGEIELADSSDHATGFIFKVQIKGKRSAKFIHNGRTLSLSIKTERLKYYMREIEIPIMLVVVDLSSENIYWKSLQDDPELRDTLSAALAANQEDARIHIPASDCLPEKCESYLLAVESNMNWLRLTATTRMTDSIESLIQRNDDELISALLEQSKRVNLMLFSEKFDRLYSSGNYNQLIGSASKVLESGTENLETRFCAAMYIDRVLEQSRMNSSEITNQKRFELFGYLQYLTREERGTERFRLYSTVLLRSILLGIRTEQDFHHYLSVESSKSNDLTAWVVEQSRSKVIIKAAGQVQKTIHLMNRIILKGHYYIFLDSLPRISSSLTMFAQRLAMEGLDEQSEYIYKWLKKCIDMSILIASDHQEDSYLAQALMLNAYYRSNLDDAELHFEESINKASVIKDGDMKKGLIEAIQDLKKSEPHKPRKMSADDELIFFQRRAKALGFNYDDPDDECGQIINQGLKDFNPERVIRNCEHLMVFPSSSLGMPAQMVGLASAGMKWLYCLKTDNARAGWDLDELYESQIGSGFKEEHCKGCSHHEARGADWEWDSEWHNQQLAEYKDLIKKVNQF